MNCPNCGILIPEGEEREHKQKFFCEDCYIDLISPVKFCDPWADYAAKSFVEKNPNSALSENQMIIMSALKENGPLDPLSLMEKLKDKISPETGERETAALHRMGKISIKNNNGTVVIERT